jgi:hypothetical protein
MGAALPTMPGSNLGLESRLRRQRAAEGRATLLVPPLGLNLRPAD